MLKKIKGPDKVGRDAMYYADRQEFAYQQGAYNYLHSVAMLPRMATLGGYIRSFGITSVLDVGCGAGDLLAYLDADTRYIGVDISATAIDAARQRYAGRADTSFHVADFRQWQPADAAIDAVVWAGIGCAWTHKGRGGSAQDWLEILALAERPLKPDGYLLLELVGAHWPTLERLVAGRYEYETGCDIDCFQSEESAKRSIRVFKRKPARAAAEADPPAKRAVISADALLPLIELARGMGQMTDEATLNLGFGYLYYGLARLYQPATVVCIGSYRGFAPVCFALGLAENRRGQCYFIDPGKVDRHWHDPANIARLEQLFGLRGRWRHLHKTSQQVRDARDIPGPIDLLFIDGDHSYQGVKFDFDHFGAQVGAGGLILLHDSATTGKGFTSWEVKHFLEAEVDSRPEYEVLTLPLAAGLTLIRKRA